MEKRNLFKTIFGSKQSNVERTRLQILNGYNAVFTSFGKGTYESKVARQCIDRIATHCAKLAPKHIKGSIAVNVKGEINYLLSRQPNPIMNTYAFIYKVVSNLYTNSNAFVYIQKDKSGFITGFYPLLATTYELYENKSGMMYLQFNFINGQQYYVPYDELIHLRLFYNQDDFYGTNSKVLDTDLETAHTASEGIKNAIRTTNNLKGMLKFTNILKPEDIKKSADKFINDFINLGDSSGIVALDSKAEFSELNLKPITLSKEQLTQVNKNIFDYFGISEHIVDNSFNSEEWNAFYEGVIEPISMQMSYEFTNKIFSEQAIKDGNEIVFTSNRLRYQKLDDKINMIRYAGSLGVMKKDEVREILDLAPWGDEEGNKIMQSLNNINSSIADNYQGGNNNGESD